MIHVVPAYEFVTCYNHAGKGKNPLSFVRYLFSQVNDPLQHMLFPFRTGNRKRQDHQPHQVIICQRDAGLELTLNFMESCFAVYMGQESLLGTQGKAIRFKRWFRVFYIAGVDNNQAKAECLIFLKVSFHYPCDIIQIFDLVRFLVYRFVIYNRISAVFQQEQVIDAFFVCCDLRQVCGQQLPDWRQVNAICRKAFFFIGLAKDLK